MLSSCHMSVFLLWSWRVYPATYLKNLILATSTRLAWDFIKVQISYLCRSMWGGPSPCRVHVCLFPHLSYSELLTCSKTVPSTTVFAHLGSVHENPSLWSSMWRFSKFLQIWSNECTAICKLLIKDRLVISKEQCANCRVINRKIFQKVHLPIVYDIVYI